MKRGCREKDPCNCCLSLSLLGFVTPLQAGSLGGTYTTPTGDVLTISQNSRNAHGGDRGTFTLRDSIGTTLATGTFVGTADKKAPSIMANIQGSDGHRLMVQMQTHYNHDGSGSLTYALVLDGVSYHCHLDFDANGTLESLDQDPANKAVFLQMGSALGQAPILSSILQQLSWTWYNSMGSIANGYRVKSAAGSLAAVVLGTAGLVVAAAGCAATAPLCLIGLGLGLAGIASGALG